MAKYCMTIGDIGDIIGKTYRCTHDKITKKKTFNIDEAQKIVNFFKNEKSENISTDEIFFSQAFANESNKSA